MSRYPVRRTKYSKTVGKTRVENITEILQNLGFTVFVGKPENDDVDIWVFKEEKLVLVIEVLNWKRQNYLDFKRVTRIRENFTNPCYQNSRKLLIFSFWKNIENQMNFFEGLDIDFLELGFQTQPLPYYIWFLNRGQVREEGRRLNNLATKTFVKRKLLTYLGKKNLI